MCVKFDLVHGFDEEIVCTGLKRTDHPVLATLAGYQNHIPVGESSVLSEQPADLDAGYSRHIPIEKCKRWRFGLLKSSKRRKAVVHNHRIVVPQPHPGRERVCAVLAVISH